MIGIVVLNYNSWNDTQDCIESIFRHDPNREYHIYVIDNASSESPSSALLHVIEDSKVTVFYNKANTGYAAGNNIGIRMALDDGCDTILISNSDVRYEDGSIEELYVYLMQNSNVGIVGPKIILRDGSVQKECMAMRTGIKEKYLLRTRAHVLFPKYNKQYWARIHDYDREIFPVYAVMGCCFMISRACALDVTPLDEATFLYEEELILGIHMEEAQWITVYDPRSVIHHLHGKSTEKVKSFAYTCNVVSEIYYCREYLKMKKWQIWPLYIYRTLLYFGKSMIGKGFRQKSFREDCRVYSNKTGAELRKNKNKDVR